MSEVDIVVTGRLIYNSNAEKAGYSSEKLEFESEKLSIKSEKQSFKNIKLAIENQAYNKPTE